MNKIINSDALEALRTLPDSCCRTCITSPPYYRLRDYGADGQIGLEDTPDQYIENLVKIFREVRRVLKDDGTLWVNIGDSYTQKNLNGIPWLLAFALKADGWILRQDIIWNEPNAMPEQTTDRCAKSHEYIFFEQAAPVLLRRRSHKRARRRIWAGRHRTQTGKLYKFSRRRRLHP